MLQIFLIRHAESLSNINNHIIGGRSPQQPLSDRGRDQARMLGERLRKEGWSFDAVFSSTALRARDTAFIACAELAIPKDHITLTDDLQEISHGDWEGKLRDEIYTAEMRARVEADSHDFRPPGGESPRDVEERMWKWLEKEVISGMEETKGRVAVFSHGFAIRSLIRRITGADPIMSFRTVTHNTSISGLEFSPPRWYLERLNDHAHLAGTEMVGHYGG